MPREVALAPFAEPVASSLALAFVLGVSSLDADESLPESSLADSDAEALLVSDGSAEGDLLGSGSDGSEVALSLGVGLESDTWVHQVLASSTASLASLTAAVSASWAVLTAFWSSARSSLVGTDADAEELGLAEAVALALGEALAETDGLGDAVADGVPL